MKNVIKNTKKGFLMVTMFFTLLSTANEASIFNVKIRAGRTSLTLMNVKKGNQLSIKDNKGIILYKEFIQQSGVFTKGFDLTALSDGLYSFELEKDLEIKTIPFSVKSNTVVLNKEEEKITYKPFVQVKDDLLYVTQLTLNEEPLKIKIYFSDFNSPNDLELMHSEEIKKTMNIQKAFKLSGLDKGTYKLVMSTNNKEYIKFISK
jgi:hypothetical protein